MRWWILGLALGCREATGDDLLPTPTPGSVRVIAGDAGDGFADGIGEQARFMGLTALCVADDGVVYGSDTFAGTLRAIDVQTGEVRTVAGVPGEPGVTDGAEGRFAGPRGLACLPGGGLLVADDGALRRVSADGVVSTVAGLPGQPGSVDGPAPTARLGYLIHAMVVTPDGSTAVITDRSNDAVRTVDLASHAVETLAGAGWSGPGGLTLDADGTGVWVADTFNSRLKHVSLADGRRGRRARRSATPRGSRATERTRSRRASGRTSSGSTRRPARSSR